MRKMMRTIVAGVVSAALATGLVSATAGPASAANAGSSCNLSANWQVKFSATYDQNTANSSYIRYIVMNTPGAVSRWQYTVINGSGFVVYGPFFRSNPPNLARVDINRTAGLPRILMEVWGPNSSYCRTSVIAYTV